MKKLLAVITALVMVLSLAACGGSSSGGGESTEASEPNGGVAGIVFSVPDSWTMESMSIGSYVGFDTETDYDVYVSTFDNENLELTKQYSEEEMPDTVAEWYEQNNSSTDEELAKDNIERATVTVCGTDAYCYTTSGDNGVISKYVSFLKDDVVYSLGTYNENNYDDEGNVKSDATVATDEELAAFDSFVESVEAGDGDALLAGMAADIDSIRSLSFEVPDGYTIDSLYENSVSFKKDGSDISLSVYVTTEDDLKWYTDENGNVPESLAEEYAEVTEWLGDEDKTTIAGIDGYKTKYTAEDGNCYDSSAYILTDDAIYNISISSDAWDNDGNIKEDAAVLTDEDLTVFDSFLASLKFN